MIVCNEANTLGDCLQSIVGVVDEIVIVDTGSTDATKTIARAHGAKLYDFEWRNDFSAARNGALDRSTSDWILYIDADERLRPVDGGYVEAVLSDPDKVAYQLRFRPVTGFTRYWECRLFRNDPRIRFERVIHEKIVPSLNRVAKDDRRQIGRCDLQLDHVGYDDDQRRKNRRDLPLLLAQIGDTPDDIYTNRHLARVLAGLGNKKSATEKLLRCVDTILQRDQEPNLAGGVYADLIRILHQQGADVDALSAEAEESCPDNHELRWFRAAILMNAGRYDEAAGRFQALAAVDEGEHCGEDTAFDERIFGVFAYQNLALCLFHLGRYAESAHFHALAADAEPGNRAHRVRQQLSEARLAAVSHAVRESAPWHRAP